MISYLPWLMVAAGAGLLVGNPISLARAAWGKVRGSLPVIDAARSSDQAAPDGFGDHVAIVLAACPAAPADVQLSYLSGAKTEAEVLRAEVQRLSEGAE